MSDRRALELRRAERMEGVSVHYRQPCRMHDYGHLEGECEEGHNDLEAFRRERREERTIELIEWQTSLLQELLEYMTGAPPKREAPQPRPDQPVVETPVTVQRRGL